MPEISVVLPVYRVEPYIEKSIRSLCAQTFRNFEVILVDDGGGDRSIEIAESVLKESALPFRVISEKNPDDSVKNCGVAAARNLGLCSAGGEWVVCVDPDDRLFPDALEVYHETLSQSKNADMLFCDYCLLKMDEALPSEEKGCESEKLDGKELAARFFDRSLPVISPSVMLKKDFIYRNQLFYPADCRFSEDVFFLWHLLMVPGLQTVHIRKKLYLYILRPCSTMTASSLDKMMTGYRKFCELDTELEKSSPDWDFDKKLVLPRWVLGACHSGAKMLSQTDFEQFVEKTDAKRKMKVLLRAGSPKVRAAAALLSFSPGKFYRTMQKR